MTYVFFCFISFMYLSTLFSFFPACKFFVYVWIIVVGQLCVTLVSMQWGIISFVSFPVSFLLSFMFVINFDFLISFTQHILPIFRFPLWPIFFMFKMILCYELVSTHVSLQVSTVVPSYVRLQAIIYLRKEKMGHNLPENIFLFQENHLCLSFLHQANIPPHPQIYYILILKYEIRHGCQLSQINIL